MAKKTFPRLFKKASSGKIQIWDIWVEGNEIHTSYGQLDGKQTTALEIVKEGKNLGKANETTPEEQALSQAESEWNTKLSRKGYVEALSKASAGENSGAGGIRPMLAQEFGKHKHKIQYVCYAQPKLDGIRCIAVVNQDGTVQLWSREQKEIVAIPSISREIESFGLPPGTILDGELYNHDLHEDFETIVSCVRKQYVASPEDQAKIQYHVYDVPSLEGPFEKRTMFLERTFNTDRKSTKIVPVETVYIHNEKELIDYRRTCQEKGYEGAMARNNVPYEIGKRSYSLLKMKEFIEGEFDIIGVEEGIGTMAGCAVFVCKAQNGNPFRCKLEGALSNLRQYIDDESTWKGKKLTIKYFRLTNKNQVPYLPVGKVVRDYE